jgi:D-2-hydroxyglutarate dehydrogenase
MQMSLQHLLRRISNDQVNSLKRLTSVSQSCIDRYLDEWLGRRGKSQLVVKPGNVPELQSVLKFCHTERIGVTVFGGNTGLVGSTVSGENEVVLSLEKMNRILSVDTHAATATVEAGVILETLQDDLATRGLTTPFDLGARGSCTVGGNISTHAGGINFIRHGPLRGHVIGLEVILADGSIVDTMSSCWKDNSGIDVKQLFIGSEGSLGVITKARIHCPPLPKFKSVAMIHLGASFNDSVLRLLLLAREWIGESLSAFEFFDADGASVVGDLPIPFIPGGFTVLIEASGAASVEDRLEAFIVALADDASRGIIANDIDGMKRLWRYREQLPVEMAKLGPNLKYDVSLPQSSYYALVEDVRKEFGGDPSVVKIVGYGHVGDGNLHLNVALNNSHDENLRHSISNFVYERVQSSNGSISAEHGIGRDKLEYIHYSKSPSALHVASKLKRMFDPNGILNPGRTVPA